MRNIDSLASSYWVLYQARSPPLRVFTCTPGLSPTTSRLSWLVSSLFVYIFIFTLAGEITNVRWCELLSRRLWGVYLSHPLLSYFVLFPPSIRGPLGGEERASPSQEGGGARTRGRARLGRTRRKENPAVFSPATVFILISWRASQTWKVTHTVAHLQFTIYNFTVYNYRGNQFCSSWSNSAHLHSEYRQPSVTVFAVI